MFRHYLQHFEILLKFEKSAHFNGIILQDVFLKRLHIDFFSKILQKVKIVILR